MRFTHAGLVCMLKEGPRIPGRRRALNGYVLIPEGHPLHGRRYNEPIPALEPILQKYLSGDTDGSAWQPPGVGAKVTVLVSGGPKPTMECVFAVHGGITFSGTFHPDPAWWIGFDTCHHDSEALGFRDPVTVEAETRRLADQVALVTKDL
jgi:hypothetical protein